jgi:hypothetical protein
MKFPWDDPDNDPAKELVSRPVALVLVVIAIALTCFYSAVATPTFPG